MIYVAEITPPPVVTVPTDKPDPDNIGKDNSINVTLIYSKDEVCVHISVLLPTLNKFL